MQYTHLQNAPGGLAVKTPDIPQNEKERIETLHATGVLDTPQEERFDRLTRMAKRLFNVPIALVSLVDANRQWFKSCYGLNVRETSRDISFCGHAILGDDPFVISDAMEDARFADNPLVTGEPHIRFYAGCPLSTANGQKLGTLCIIDRNPKSLCAEDIDILKDLAGMVEKELDSYQMATFDEVTNISNRRGFRILAEHSLSVCARQHIHASLINIDLDKFKFINDKFGHAEGDRALAAFGQLMRTTCRESDVFGRLSGDEFAMLLIDTSPVSAHEVIERFSKAVDEYNAESRRGYDILFSYGIVGFDPDCPRTLHDLMGEADTLMYELKRSRK